MSFGVNPASNKPVIREAASMNNDGGAGNLGYFEQGENKEKKHSEGSIFSEEKEADSFEKTSDKEEVEVDFSISKFIANIIFSIKEWLKKLMGNSEQ